MCVNVCVCVCVCACVRAAVFVMACLWVLQTNEETGRDGRSLACRRSVSWYGFKLNRIKETREMSSELRQVRQDVRVMHLLATFLFAHPPRTP